MNRTDLKAFGRLVSTAISEIEPPDGRGTLTKALYEKLKSSKKIRTALREAFEGPVKLRYAGCPPILKDGQTRKVLGYLWDLSFSRFAIPEAIKESDPGFFEGRKYEILFVLESELGTFDEICRDLLKLLEARAAIRCLVYKAPRRRRQALHDRFVAVLHNHAHFNPATERWLFMGVSWSTDRVSCDGYVLARDGSRLLLLDANTPVQGGTARTERER